MVEKTLGDVATYINGRAFKPQEWETSGRPIIRIQNLTNSTQECNRTTKQFEEKYRISDGDLLFAWSASLGAHIWHGEDGWLNQHIFKVIPNESIDKIYLYYYLLYVVDQLYAKTHGSGMVHITLKPFKSTRIMLPELNEQRRVVGKIESLFAKLDEAKEKAQAVVDSFETRKAAILHKAFTGELTAKWREEHGVGMESWEQCSLSDVCTVNPKKADTKDLPDELEVSFFPMSALSEIYGEITDPQTRLLKEVRSGFTNFSEGDVVFAKITPCMENGKSAVVGKLVNDIGYGTTEFFVLRCSDRLYNRFLYHLVRDKLFRDKAKAVMAGAVGQQRVPKRYLETYKLNLPKFNEQREIVRILDGSFAKEQQTKEAAEAVLDQIELMKKSILARAFRGELGTNDPNEESAVELLKEIIRRG
jgi:type I restriction enzyme S subunit